MPADLPTPSSFAWFCRSGDHRRVDMCTTIATANVFVHEFGDYERLWNSRLGNKLAIWRIATTEGNRVRDRFFRDYLARSNFLSRLRDAVYANVQEERGTSVGCSITEHTIASR